jgi:hypothetical protein
VLLAVEQVAASNDQSRPAVQDVGSGNKLSTARHAQGIDGQIDGPHPLATDGSGRKGHGGVSQEGDQATVSVPWCWRTFAPIGTAISAWPGSMASHSAPSMTLNGCAARTWHPSGQV